MNRQEGGFKLAQKSLKHRSHEHLHRGRYDLDADATMATKTDTMFSIYVSEASQEAAK